MQRGKIINKHAPTILANDPSMTAWGWAIMTPDGLVLDCGFIQTKPGGKKCRIRKADIDIQRYSTITQTILELINKWNVQFVVSELQHGSQNAAAAKYQGAVTALLVGITDTLNISIEWFSENDSKKCLLGKNSASKQETIDAIKRLYKVSFTGKKNHDEAVADAIAIHYVASKQSSIFKLLKNNFV